MGIVGYNGVQGTERQKWVYSVYNGQSWWNGEQVKLELGIKWIELYRARDRKVQPDKAVYQVKL